MKARTGPARHGNGLNRPRRSEPIRARNLKRPRRLTIENRMVIRTVGEIRAGIPLRIRTRVEHVEHVQRRLELVLRDPEDAADGELQITVRVVGNLSVAPSRPSET